MNRNLRLRIAWAKWQKPWRCRSWQYRLYLTATDSGFDHAFW